MKIISHPSPNFNERPGGTVVDTVVLHYTDMENAQSALERLCDPAAKVSAHYLIDVDGTIYQLVKDEKRAWHAGVSSWQGRDNVNDFSIGIEIQNPGYYSYFVKYGKWDPYPEVQMKNLVSLLKLLQAHYPIAAGNIVGHCDITPERKIDPGPHFNWAYLAKHGLGKLCV